MTTQFPNCPILTQVPHCLPHTVPPVCHILTSPPQCLPHTLAGINCPHVTANPVLCHVVTHNSPLCGVQCLGGTHIPPTTIITTTPVQQTIAQTPVLHGGLAAPAQAQHFAAAQANVGPTGVQYCTAAPAYCGNTAWQGCAPQAAPAQAAYYPTTNPTANTHCFVCPPQTIDAAQAQANAGPTGVYNCTASPQTCGNTAWHGCQPLLSAPPHCPTVAPACPPQAAPVAQAAYHPTTNPTANTHCFICPPHTIDTAQAQANVGPTGVHYCTAAPQTCGHTAWPVCPPLLSAPPHCPTVATVCQPLLSAPPHCPTVAPACPPQQAAPQPQALPPTHIVGCTCLPMTVGPVVPTHNMPVCGNTCLPMTVGPVIPTQNMPICGTHGCLPMTLGPVIPTHNMPICNNPYLGTVFPATHIPGIC